MESWIRRFGIRENMSRIRYRLLGCLLVSKLCTTQALPQIYRTEDTTDTIEIVGLESDGSLMSTTGYFE